jgi:hypothetical protein
MTSEQKNLINLARCLNKAAQFADKHGITLNNVFGTADTDRPRPSLLPGQEVLWQVYSRGSLREAQFGTGVVSG